MERSGILSKNAQEIAVRLDFERFPRDLTCDGANFSPEIRIEGLDSPYLAIIIDDPDAASGTWTHWILYNVPKTEHIPGNIPKRPELDKPFSGRQGINTSGSVGYDGPCPPRGQTHRYFVKAYGLTTPLEAAPGSSIREVESELKVKANQQGEAMATYGR